MDTQILLRLICLQFENVEFEDMAFRSVKQLNDYIKDSNNLIVTTTHDYILEVAGHIQEALKLDRFFSLPALAKFDIKSKNIFYNYYQALIKSNQYDADLTIKDFITDLLGVEPPSFNSNDFIYFVSGVIEKLFNFLNIEIIYHPKYENYFEMKREYELMLFSLDKIRSYSAADNDLRTIMYLSEPENNVDSESGTENNPFLITWDNTFYPIRKQILSAFNRLSYWYIYTPSKLVDRLSIMNFKLNPASINYNIISITESNFNYNSKTISFFDLMSTLFNKEDLSEIKLAHKLIDLENKTKVVNELPHGEDVSEEKSPLIDVLLELRNHYSKPEMKLNTNDLIKAFEDNTKADDIFNILSENITYYLQSKKIKLDIFDKFNEIISPQI